MLHAFRRYVETHLGSVLVASFFIGLCVPGLEDVPTVVVPALLAVVIYFSTSKTSAKDFSNIRYGHALAFVALRFLALPVVLYLATMAMAPSFGVAVLLLALMPAGASCAAMAGIMEANVGLALGITLLSGFLAPLSVPFAFWLIGKNGITVDISTLFWSLVKIVILPMLVYYQGARRMPRIAAWSKTNASFISTVLIGALIVLVVARGRAAMIEDPIYLAKSAIVSSLVFGFFYVVGWWFPWGGDRRVRMSHTLASGAMNNGLAISLAVLYFPPEVSLFMVITEIPWPLGIALFRRLTASGNSLPRKTAE